MLILAVNALALHGLAVNGALGLYVVSTSVLYPYVVSFTRSPCGFRGLPCACLARARRGALPPRERLAGARRARRAAAPPAPATQRPCLDGMEGGMRKTFLTLHRA